jgi:DHA1 family bicyclomycin/chloramphenicol resistance-like MFS transporter
MTPPAAGAKSPLLFTILVAVSTVGPLAMNIFVPSIPGLMKQFNASSGTVQLTLTIYLAGIAVSQLFYGPISDRIGRRPAMLAGLTFYVFASALCAIAPTIELLMVARFFQAIGGAAGMVLSRAIVRDLHGREASASVLGYITMTWVLVPMFAPALGGFLDEIATWRASFYVLTGLGSVILALAWWGLPETNLQAGSLPASSHTRANALVLVRQPAFAVYTLTLAFCSAVFFSFIAGAPYIMVEVLGRTPFEYGLWFMLISVGYMAGNYLSGRFSEQIGIDRMITYGNSLAIVGACAMLAFGIGGNLGPATIFGPMLIVTLGNGLTIPNGTAAAISVLPGTIGIAAGISGFFQTGIGALGSQVTGQLQGSMPLAALWVMAASAILAGLMHQFRPSDRGQAA